ncbi:MAG TPA: hypothetical protein VKR53_07630 [Puia sp.]|nr:hypothetical protein [Puia sp.]
MSIRIDLVTIRLLKKGDIIYHPKKSEKYSIWEIGKDFIIAELQDETRYVELFRFHKLINDGWRAVDGVK